VAHFSPGAGGPVFTRRRQPPPGTEDAADLQQQRDATRDALGRFRKSREATEIAQFAIVYAADLNAPRHLHEIALPDRFYYRRGPTQR
jgi:hypothetical protein